MICRELERYDRGELDEADFILHASRCSICREALRLDREVMSLAKATRKPIEAPQLWSRIEKALQDELSAKSSIKKEPQTRKGFRFDWLSNRRKSLWLVPASAALMVCVAFGIYFGLRSSRMDSGLLAQKALAKVEQKEQEYMEAIRELEKQALPRMADMDLELEFLYRDRLETIDAQIARCQEALSSNPANGHIRRYLMAALQDKKDTLTEVLNIRAEKSDSRRST
jgi:hypothetical protein